MQALAKWLYLAALIVWVGEIVFLSFVVAPSIFRTFPTADAGRAVGAIFPTYYRVGYVCGVILVATAVILFANAGSRRGWAVNGVLAAVMLAATLYAGLIIQPRAAELRPQIHDPNAPPSIKDEFDRLHQRAVQLNGGVLLCGVVVTLITATAIRP